MMSLCGIPNCRAQVISRGMCRPHYDKWWAKTPASERPAPQSQLNEISALDVAWLAGLIEGEGTFFCSLRRARQYPVIAVGMTDDDVVRKAHTIVGAGKVYITSIRGMMKKTRFTWKVSRAADVLALAMLVRPHMGKRRREQIDSMVATSCVKYIEEHL